METSLKTGFAQIFSCCPKNLSCPNFGGAAAPLAPPARTPMLVTDEKPGPSSLALYLLICSRVRRYIKQCNHIAKQSKQYRKLLFPRRV